MIAGSVAGNTIYLINVVLTCYQGAMSKTVSSPLSRLTILQQTYHQRYTNDSKVPFRTIPLLRTIWKEEGFYGLFRGNGTRGIYLIFYDN